MGAQESSTFYILRIDDFGKVIGTDEQQLTGDISPSLTDGDIIVNKKIYDTVVIGQERYESFRYVGGDLIWDGPDLEVILRRSKQSLHNSANRAVEYCSFNLKADDTHTVFMSSDLLARINTSLAVQQSLQVLDTEENLLKLETPILRRIVRDYVERYNYIMITLHGAIKKISGLKSTSQIQNLTERMCNRIEGH